MTEFEQIVGADVLSEAAWLIRERAKKASVWEGYWEVDPKHPARVIEDKNGNGWDDAIIAKCVDYGNHENGVDQAQHIAGWQPGPAALIADWLDQAARDMWAHGFPDCCTDGCDECDDYLLGPHLRYALAFAKAYLTATPAPAPSSPEGDDSAGGVR